MVSGFYIVNQQEKDIIGYRVLYDWLVQGVQKGPKVVKEFLLLNHLASSGVLVDIVKCLGGLLTLEQVRFHVGEIVQIEEALLELLQVEASPFFSVRFPDCLFHVFLKFFEVNLLTVF